MKVLNLYAGPGGNRKLWEDVEVTAVEIDPQIAKIYEDHFPGDEVIITDAHQFLLDNFQDYDFIWSSPPCPTHSIFFKYVVVPRGQSEPKYPDMRLYQEIIFLQGYCKSLYCVENVRSWYKPLIRPQKAGRHFFWANFTILDMKTKPSYISKVGATEDFYINHHGFDLSQYKLENRKDQVYHNIMDPLLGKHILDCARGTIIKPLTAFSKSKRINRNS